MHPILFTIPVIDFPIYTFAVLTLASVMLSLQYISYESKRRGLDAENNVNFAIEVFLAGLIGTRLLFVAMNWSDMNPPGTSVFGMLFNTINLRTIFCRIARNPTGQSCVMTVPSARLYMRMHRRSPSAFRMSCVASSRVMPEMLCTCSLHISQKRVRSSPTISSQFMGQGDAIRMSSSCGSCMISFPEDGRVVERGQTRVSTHFQRMLAYSSALG